MEMISRNADKGTESSEGMKGKWLTFYSQHSPERMRKAI
jgi:hypothetical protein